MNGDILNNCILCIQHQILLQLLVSYYISSFRGCFNDILVSNNRYVLTETLIQLFYRNWMYIKVANLLEIENLTLFITVSTRLKKPLCTWREAPVVRLKGFKYLKVHILENFTWTTHTTAFLGRHNSTPTFGAWGCSGWLVMVFVKVHYLKHSPR